MVSLGSLLEHLLVLRHLLFVLKRDAVDALERSVLGITKEIGSRVPHDGESFYPAGFGDVRPPTKVDERAVWILVSGLPARI